MPSDQTKSPPKPERGCTLPPGTAVPIAGDLAMIASSDEYIGFQQVKGLTGLGPGRLSILIRLGLFPARNRQAQGRWNKADVLEWLRASPDGDGERR